MPGARCTGRLACKIAKKRTRAYRFSGGNPAFPAQWFYGVLRAPGLFDTVACASYRRLDASIGASERHDLAVRRQAALVSRAANVHRIPPRVRDVRNAPLLDRTVRISELILVRWQARISEIQKLIGGPLLPDG